MNDYKKKLSDVFLRVGSCSGIVSEHGEDEIAIKAGCFDDYILMTFIGKLIEDGECEIMVAPGRVEYFLKLLHIKEIENE